MCIKQPILHSSKGLFNKMDANSEVPITSLLLFKKFIVVYFDQRTGAPHAVYWLKSFFDAKTIFLTLKRLFTSFLILFNNWICKITLKMTISTSVWSGQHPNAGRNIQKKYLLNMKKFWCFHLVSVSRCCSSLFVNVPCFDLVDNNKCAQWESECQTSVQYKDPHNNKQPYVPKTFNGKWSK